MYVIGEIDVWRKLLSRLYCKFRERRLETVAHLSRNVNGNPNSRMNLHIWYRTFLFSAFSGTSPKNLSVRIFFPRWNDSLLEVNYHLQTLGVRSIDKNVARSVFLNYVVNHQSAWSDLHENVVRQLVLARKVQQMLFFKFEPITQFNPRELSPERTGCATIGSVSRNSIQGVFACQHSRNKRYDVVKNSPIENIYVCQLSSRPDTEQNFSGTE